MDLEAEYNNRARVPGHPAIIAGWQRDAAAWRAACPRAELDLAYGESAREKLDLFWPEGRDEAPMAIFIHGGYWQALDKNFHSHCARGLVERGIAVAVPSYDLCPQVTMETIVAQMRAAALFLWRRHGRRLFAYGHSAGGHLSAMLAATDWAALGATDGTALRAPARLVPAIGPISGVFELEPLLGTSVAEKLGLDQARARALSPRFFAPPAEVAVHAVVGGAESGEFIRQTRDFATAWGGTAEEAPGEDHFTVIAPLADAASAMVERFAGMVPVG